MEISLATKPTNGANILTAAHLKINELKPDKLLKQGIIRER
jgi:hypothetical protein